MADYALGRIPHPETPRAASIYPVVAHPAYKVTNLTRKLWEESEAWLDQGQTGTCVANALAHRYADGPVDHQGVTETMAQRWYVQATGDTTLQNGTSALTVCRWLKSQGLISAYHWCTSPLELRNAVLSIGPVCVGIPWYSSCFSPAPAHGSDRCYFTVDRSSLAGGHEIEINGIELAPMQGPAWYRIKNSWSKAWPGSENPGVTVGGPGTARFACADLEELIFNEGGDAVLVTEVP